MSIPVVESGKTGHVELLAVRAIAKELEMLSKVVFCKGEQITVDWAARNYIADSRAEVTVQVWSEPFKIAVYDAS